MTTRVRGSKFINKDVNSLSWRNHYFSHWWLDPIPRTQRPLMTSYVPLWPLRAVYCPLWFCAHRRPLKSCLPVLDMRSGHVSIQRQPRACVIHLPLGVNTCEMFRFALQRPSGHRTSQFVACRNLFLYCDWSLASARSSHALVLEVLVYIPCNASHHSLCNFASRTGTRSHTLWSILFPYDLHDVCCCQSENPHQFPHRTLASCKCVWCDRDQCSWEHRWCVPDATQKWGVGWAPQNW